MTESTCSEFPSCSANLPAAIQISWEVGIVLRALFNTPRALSGVSNLANANHNSCDVGITSTARDRRIRASSGLSSNLTVSFHNRTEAGIYSRAKKDIFQYTGESLKRIHAYLYVKLAS